MEEGDSDPEPCADATVTSVDGHELRLFVGQFFVTREQGTSFVHDFALVQGRRAVLDRKRSGGRSFRFQCDGGSACPFFIKIFKIMAEGSSGYRVSSFCHGHGMCTSSARPTAHQVAAIPTVGPVVAANPRMSARAIQEQVQSTHGIGVNTRMLHRVRERIVDGLSVEYHSGFHALPSLLSEFARLNSTAVTATEFNDRGEFVRAFVSHPHAVNIQRTSPQVLGIDGAFMKHGRFDQMMLILVTRDGNAKNRVLTVGLCPTESSDHCQWFVDKCHEAGITTAAIPVLTDRGKGLLAALSTSTGAIVRYCTRHIIGNILQRFGKNQEGEARAWNIQGQQTKEGYTSAMFVLWLIDEAVADYVAKIPPELWVLYPVIESVKLYGWRTSNFVESENAVAVPVRFMMPFEFFSHYMERFMTEAASVTHNATEWEARGQSITPHVLKLIAEQEAQMGFYKVKKSSGSIAFVQDTRHKPPRGRRVDLGTGLCSCLFVHQEEVPCRHVLKALAHRKRSADRYLYVDESYRTSAYKASGVQVAHLPRFPARDVGRLVCASNGTAVGDEANAQFSAGWHQTPTWNLFSRTTPDDRVNPPPRKRRRGHIRSARLPSQDENLQLSSASGSKGRNLCSKCREVGHNRRTSDA